jgi:NDP-sugar pyrophosphorylase family protein
VALFKRDDVSQSGVAELDGDRRIIRFTEKPRAGEISSRWVSAGILVLEPEVLDVIPSGRPSDFGRDILPPLLAVGRPVYGYCMGGTEKLWWIDTPEDYRRVCADWERG